MNTTQRRQFEPVYQRLRLGDYGGAIKRVLNRRSGRVRQEYSKSLNHAWYVVGDAHYRSGNFEAAISAFKKSSRHGKDDVEPLLAIANSYSESRKPRYAVHYLRRAIDQFGSDARLLYNLGNAYFDLRQYDEATRIFSRLARGRGSISAMAKRNLQAIEFKKKER